MRILGNRLLLAPLPPREQSAGGIILPQGQAGDVMYFWKVDAVGAGKALKNGDIPVNEFSVGDTVITPLYFDHTTLEDGTKRKIVGCEQIVGKLETVPDLTVLPACGTSDV